MIRTRHEGSAGLRVVWRFSHRAVTSLPHISFVRLPSRPIPCVSIPNDTSLPTSHFHQQFDVRPISRSPAKTSSSQARPAASEQSARSPAPMHSTSFSSSATDPTPPVTMSSLDHRANVTKVDFSNMDDVRKISSSQVRRAFDLANELAYASTAPPLKTPRLQSTTQEHAPT